METNKGEEEEEEQSRIESLQSRIKELEVENARLSSQLAHCRCTFSFSKIHNYKDKKKDTTKSRIRIPDNHVNVRSLHLHSKRYVALKLLYFGQRFYGFASEAQMDPTVESELFKAFEKTRLLLGDRKSSQYSRCGRTDRGVSAAGQVIALFLRSNLKAETSTGGVIFGGQYEGEIDYVRVLNKVLPKDIRIIGWSPVPKDFHARFGCISREYKYFFWSENLNISDMQMAAKKFLGEHDFRNFCKMDAENVHNYKRCITSFDIAPCCEKFGGKEMRIIIIRGSAFLWHQVRCMVAVLFMIGRGLESTEVVDMLLDIERTPKKPQYTMASEMPLVLNSCEFQDLQFYCSPDARHALLAHLTTECQDLMLQFAIVRDALDSCSSTEEDEGGSSFEKIMGTKKCLHIPLMMRPTEPTYDERRAKLNSRCQRSEAT